LVARLAGRGPVPRACARFYSFFCRCEVRGGLTLRRGRAGGNGARVESMPRPLVMQIHADQTSTFRLPLGDRMALRCPRVRSSLLSLHLELLSEHATETDSSEQYRFRRSLTRGIACKNLPPYFSPWRFGY